MTTQGLSRDGNSDNNFTAVAHLAPSSLVIWEGGDTSPLKAAEGQFGPGGQLGTLGHPVGPLRMKQGELG